MIPLRLEKNQLCLLPLILQGPPGRPGLPGADGVPGPPGTILMLPVSPAAFHMPTRLSVLFPSHTVCFSSQATARELALFLSLPHSITSRPSDRSLIFFGLQITYLVNVSQCNGVELVTETLKGF